ncbi:dTDP-4-dehydrorhamnose reductase [Nitrincola tibetensis]|uniref:dTDP-4-dehydrorhamnose reductase n=1 Tax=Nitrincola tibetensis TaxID=2219697 RepID=A0A364NQ86_9GAMM|nr:dTDP-4-dehydrorhamnose reductase [Nitrincola tibetensis]RAU19192.1 dTDP-4-dehydrorhamnose reductase [Nitrincola tibetensis]
MATNRILVLGGSGQVGFELIRVFSLQGNVQAPLRKELDLTSESAVTSYLDEFQPSLILNAAAYTAVDKAESEPVLADRLNHLLPAQLSVWAARHSAMLVHYSSDYVYPGNGTLSWMETDPAGPCNEYGRSKLKGDQAIQSSGCQYHIFRTSWVYSARGHNFMKTMLALGKDRSALKVVSDQVGAPTPARLIALVTLQAFLKLVPSGIYHLAPRGEVSWHGFAQAIFTFAAAKGMKLTIVPEAVEAIPSSDYPTPAQRPQNSRLNITQLELTMNCELPSWESQLQLTIEEYLS